jgi:hypothetical protein
MEVAERGGRPRMSLAPEPDEVVAKKLSNY